MLEYKNKETLSILTINVNIEGVLPLILKEIKSNSNIIQHLENGDKLLLISKFDYCIAYMDETHTIRDYQTNTILNISRHPFNKAYIAIDDIPKEPVHNDNVEKLFHLVAIKGKER